MSPSFDHFEKYRWIAFIKIEGENKQSDKQKRPVMAYIPIN